MIVKFISNVDAELYIDQEKMSLLESGKIFKCQLEIGSYLLEVVPVDKSISTYVEDYDLIEEKQTLKRIEFDVLLGQGASLNNDTSSSVCEKDEAKPLSLDFNNRGIAVEKRYGIEHFVTRDGKVWIGGVVDGYENDHDYVLDLNKYDWCGLKEYCHENKESFLPVVKNDKWGLCKVVSGSAPTELLPCIYDKVQSVYADWRLAVLKKGNKLVLVNLNGDKYDKDHELSGQYIVSHIGKELCEITCDNLYPIVRVDKKRFFSWRSCRDCITTSFFPHSVVATSNGKYGICHFGNSKPIFLYDDLFSIDESENKTNIFCEDIPMIARKGGSWGLVNSDGVELTQFIYEDISTVGELFVAKTNNGLSLLNRSGIEIIPQKFDGVSYEKKSQSYFVNINGKYGVFSIESNTILLPCIYDSIQQIEYMIRWTFEAETIYAYLCMLNGKKGVIDKEGKALIECKYDDIEVLSTCTMCGDSYDGYILKENGLYGWWTHSKGLVSECIYNNINYSIDDFTNERFVIIQKDYKWGCYDLDGRVVFNIEYDSIEWGEDYEGQDDYTLKFLCSKDGKIYVKDSENHVYNVLDYEEIIPSPGSVEGFCYVKKNGLYGIIRGKEDPITYIECEYDSLDILAETTNCIYICACKNARKYLIESELECKLNHISAIDCDVIYPLQNVTNKRYYERSRINAFAFVKDGKQGVLDLCGEIVVPALYDKIVQVEVDSQGRITYIVTSQDGMLAVYDINHRCVIPAAYQNIVFRKNYFVVTKDNSSGIYSVEGRLLLPCLFNQKTNLCRRYLDIFSDLIKNPNSNKRSDMIPIEIWEAEYNTYVAFNRESGTIISGNPLPFEELCTLLKKYKQTYLSRS